MFGDSGYNAEEADVVAINDDRHASLARFRRLTSIDLTASKQNPTLMLAKLMEQSAKERAKDALGGYDNEAMIADSGYEESMVKVPIDQVTGHPKASPIAVDCRDLTFTYGYGKTASLILKRINVQVPQGKIYALLGSSGCGKTTFLRCVLGRLTPQQGIIRCFGREPGSKWSPIPGPGVGYMPQELALFPDFTIKETLRYFGQLYRMSEKDIKARTKFLITLLHLPDKNRLVQQLSGGQQRRVSLASALVHHPPLLILDEPTVGVDPVLRKAIWEHLDALCKDDGLTVIITTHYIEEARTAETVGLMRFGRMLVQEKPDDLLVKYSAPTLEAVFLKLCQLDSSPENATMSEGQTNQAMEKELDSNANEQSNHRVANTNVNTNLPSMTISTIENEKNSIDNKDLESGGANGGTNGGSLAANKSMGNQLSLGIPTNFKDVSARATPANRSPEDSISEKSEEAEWATSKMLPETKRTLMDPARVRAQFIKNVIRLKRNVPILMFYFFLPSIQIALFCICIGQDPKNIPVAIYNAEDPPGLSAEYLSFLDAEVIKQMPVDSLEEARQMVIDGKAWAAMHFANNYSFALNQRRILTDKADNDTIDSSNIKLYMDMSNQVIGFVLLRTFFKAFQTFAQDYLSLLGYNPATVTLPIVIEETIYGQINPSMTAFMAPGVILLIAYYATTALTALALVLERKDGLLERSLVAGVNSVEFLTSHIMTQVMVLTIQEILMLFTTFFIFSVENQGPFIWVFILTFMQGVAGVMFGLFISSICADEVSAAMLGMGSFFPTIMLGGIFWPVQSMPDWMSYIAAFLPQTLPVESLRFILSRGWDIFYFEVVLGFLATGAWIIIFLVASTFIFRKFAT